MNLFGRKKTETTTCIAVMNSYAVTAVVVRTYTGDETVRHPVVMFLHTESVASHHGRDERLLNESACRALHQAIEACRKYSGSYDSITCVIGEPWVTTIARTAHHEKPAPVAITQAMIDELVARDRRLFIADIERDYPGRDVGLVAVSHPRITLNGYPVNRVNKQRAKTVDAVLGYSITDAAFMDEIIGVYIDVLHRTDVTFASMDLIRASAVQGNDIGMVIELGGVTSTIAVVERGIPMREVTIPMGLSDLQDFIAQLFGVTSQMVPSVMRFASDEQLVQHVRDEYYKRIEQAYAPIGVFIERAVIELRGHTGIASMPAILINEPEWINVIGPLIEKSIGADVITTDGAHAGVVYAHGVTPSAPLTLAIQAVARIT